MSAPRSWFPVACVAGALLLSSGCGPDTTAAPPPASPAPAPADVVTVTTVVDGDTFDVSDGRRIRVLGIDSCESETDAGRDATDAATRALLGKPVTLVAEPGADRDPYGRVLRYAQLPDGSDFGKSMVPFPHTGVYLGGGASAPYVAELQALDVDGQTCDRPDPATTPAPPPTTNENDDPGRAYVPVPDPDESSRSGTGSNDDSGTKPRSGHSGHPCLPGERDGDGDGYCGEGRS